MKRLVAVIALWHFWVLCGTAGGGNGLEVVVCPHDVSAAQAYYCYLNLGMQIWTELDILGAIRTSTEDLMYFADILVDKLLELQYVLLVVKNCHGKESYGYEDLANMSDIARQIDDRFFDIFSLINSKEVVCCTVLIERLRATLEGFSFKNTM